MNLLYLAHRLPYPPNKGDKLRAFRQLEHLSKSHRVWCASFVDCDDDLRYLRKMRHYCHDLAAVRLHPLRAKWRGMKGLIRGGTITESYYDHPMMWDQLRQWDASIYFDAVLAFSSSMAPYALSVSADRRVLDLCDLDSEKWRSYARYSRGPMRKLYQCEAQRLAKKEREWIEAFDTAILITEAEAKPIRHLFDQHKLQIIGNGVDLTEIDKHLVLPLNDQRTSMEIKNQAHCPRKKNIVGFVGVMDYKPNVDAVTWFAKTAWPVIHRAIPGAIFRIVGRTPTAKIRKLQTIPGVVVVGEVKEVAEEVCQFDVSVAPLRIGRGLQNKVLEAMAAARPVVLTTTAAEGIAAEHNRHYVVADRPGEIAAQVIRLLRFDQEGHQLGRAARQFVTTHHNWPRVLKQLEWIVTGVLDKSAVIPAPSVAIPDQYAPEHTPMPSNLR